jgi:hypothetical protein
MLVAKKVLFSSKDPVPYYDSFQELMNTDNEPHIQLPKWIELNFVDYSNFALVLVMAYMKVAKCQLGRRS